MAHDKVPYTDLKPKIIKFFYTLWQLCWNNNIHNKSFQIKPKLEEFKPAFRKIYTRTSHYILIVYWLHKPYAHFYTQTKGTITVYSMPSPVKHFLTECRDLALIKQ